MNTQHASKSKDTSLLITVIVVISIIVITALLTIIYTIQNNPNAVKIFPNISIADSLFNTEKQLAQQGQIQQFDSYSDLIEYIEQHNNYTGFNNTRNFATVDMIMRESATPQVSTKLTNNKLAGKNNNYSSTNIQVEGVDEADIIKTDGDYIYTISGNTVYIINAQPAENMNIVSEIKLENKADNIYINNNHLVVFGNDYSLFNTKKITDIIPRSQYTFIKIYNISDKSNPKEVRQLNFEGFYTNSRMIGDYLYFITSYWPDTYTNTPIPRLIDNGKLVCNSDIPNGIECPYVNYFNIPYPSQQMTTVSAINIANPDEKITRNIYILAI